MKIEPATTHPRPPAWGWVFFLTRVILGLMFFMGAWWRIFDIGPADHARRFFLEPYVESWLPAWSLWTVGMAVPFVEFAAGAMLLLGFRVRLAAVLLGCELLVLTFGHFLAEPLFSITGHIFPRFVLVLVLLLVPVTDDAVSLDRWLSGHGARSGLGG